MKSRAGGKTDTGKQELDQDPWILQHLLSSKADSTEHSQVVP